MACLVCDSEKLSNEFPPYNASTDCDHPCLTCLRCLVDKVTKTGTCPYPGCQIQISKACDAINLFKEILCSMFTEYDSEYTPPAVVSGDGCFVNITGLTGIATRVPFTPQMTVVQLKKHIQEKQKTPISKQKLLYKNIEMKTNKENKTLYTLLDYGVEPNTTISLVVCLYSIPENFDHVVFDLFWGFPTTGPDYLDATCFIFSEERLINLVDFRRSSDPAVKHSGDIMDQVKKQGHHTIEVHLQKIPSNITHMFFTLSAWNSPTISKFPNPSLRFFEASKPTKNLCSTSFSHANSSEAVVMCSMSNKTGIWQIYDSGKLSSGNAMRYQPLMRTIVQLISSGY